MTVIATAGFAAAANAQVMVTNLNELNLTLKVLLQSPGYNSDDGAVRTYDNPVVQTINTKNLLDRLAVDKQLQGDYGFGTFPPGAKLGVVDGKVVVVGPDRLLLADVSDIVTFSYGTNALLSGTVNNASGLADPRTAKVSLLRLDFDDTFIPSGGGLVFFVQGFNVTKTKDSKVNDGTGKYLEKTNSKMANAVGEGSSGGTPIVVTGTIKGNGHDVLTYSPPAT